MRRIVVLLCLAVLALANPSEELEKWLLANGARIEKLKVVSHTDSFREVQAAQDIESGELIITIPRQLLITTKTAQATPVGEIVKSHCTLYSHQSHMALFLVIEKLKGAESFLAPNINIFPQV